MSPDTNNKKTERRSGFDRRQFSYAQHLPERRNIEDRRRRRPSKRLQDALPVREVPLSGNVQPIG
jgi:hypothetical protein